MSTFQVGRVGLDVEITEVESWELTGDTVRVAGVLLAETIADAKALRQQLNGYVSNGDEEIVPVTWSEDSSVDGFYRVTGVSVGTVPASLVANWFTFSLDLERIGGFAGPLMETVIVGAVRTNVHAITSPNAVAVVGVPDDALEFHDTADPAAGDVFTRTAAEGPVRLVKSDTYTRRQTFALDPADWYIGAARIEIGSPYRTVVGQQIPAERDTWRLSNGLVRMRPNENGFGLSCFDGTTWSPETIFTGTVGGSSLGGTVLATSLRVLRNSPEECIIRLPVAIPSALAGALGVGTIRVDIDLAVRRGERTIRVFLASTEAEEFGVEAVNTTASTALTGGIRATSNDSNGDRFVLATPQTVTNDLTQGGFALSSPEATFAYAVGFEVGGSGAATDDVAQQLAFQYHAAHSERVVVASR